MKLTKPQRAALDALPPKRRTFVLALVGEAAGNLSEAARIAGYAQPEMEGSRLMKFDAVAKAAELLRAPVEDSKIASREERLAWLSSVMRQEVEADAQTRDRLKAAELIAKMSGDMIERREISGAGGAPIPMIALVAPAGAAEQALLGLASENKKDGGE